MKNPVKLLNYYLTIKHLTCCSFRGGYFVKINGVEFSGKNEVDEFWMSAGWPERLNEILNGKTTSSRHLINPWEGSQLTIERKGEKLNLKAGSLVATTNVKGFTRQMHKRKL